MERNWAELPTELLSKIMNRLCITSIDSFKDVCQNWNSSVLEEVNLSLLKPLQSPPCLSISGELNSGSSFFSVSNNKVYYLNKKKHVWRPPAVDVARCVGSCHGWLAYINYLCVIYLTNPFKYDGDESSTIKLPSIETLPCILGIDEVSSSSSCINFKYWNSYTDDAYIAPSNRTYNFFITKLVMSSTPSKDCIVMVNYGELCQIAFCKVGEVSWTTLGQKLNYDDLYYSSDDHCFYALCTNTWSIEVWDLRDSSSPNIITSIELRQPQLFDPVMTRYELSQCLSTQNFYLAQLHGELLLVVKFTTDVHKDRQVIRWRDEYHEFIKGGEEETYDGEVSEEANEESVVDDEEVSEESVVDEEEINEESVVEDEEVNEKSVVDEESDEEDDSDTSSDSEPKRDVVPYITFCFMVYKLDMVKKKWVVTTNGLGDGGDALFLGVNNAIAFSPIEFPELKSNSIYFTDDKYTPTSHGSSSFGGHDLGIFSFEDYNIYPCYFSEDTIQILPPPVWISPNPW